MTAKKPGFVKSAILSWLGVPFDLTTGDALTAFGSGVDGITVNRKTVMSISAAWACVRLISETGASLPLVCYERKPNGERVPARDYPLAAVVGRRPNSETTKMVFWESSIASLMLSGHSFAEIHDIGGRTVALDFLDGNRLSKKDSAGSVYSYTDADGTIREIPRRRLFKITGFTLDGKRGVSAISYGAQAFGGAIAANKAATTTLSKGMTAKIAFLVDRIVHQDKRDEYREYLDRHVFGPMNAGEPVIMEKGMDAKVLSINPKDAQLIETRGFNVEDVCRFFRVDPSMIGHGNKDSNWGTGLEQKMISFLTFTLSPWLIRIEEALNNFLIPPADQNRYYFEFNIEGLLRADSTSRANFYQIMVNHGIMTRDQVRVKENWPQMGGNADKLTVNSAQILLDDLGKKSDADRVRSALAEWLKSEEKPDEK